MHFGAMSVDRTRDDVVSPWPLEGLHVRCVPKCIEDKKNHGLRGGLAKLYSRGGLFSVFPKFHNGCEREDL